MFRRRQRSSAAHDPAATSTGAGREAARREDAPVSVLQAGCVVAGPVTVRGRLRLHGTIRGDVEVAGVLEVGADGVIEASSVRAESLVVLGRVVADVDVAGSVELWKGAVLHGDVQAAEIDIESGASFVGRSLMRPTSSPSSTVPAVAAEDAAGQTGAAGAAPGPDAPESASERDAGSDDDGSPARGDG